MWRKGYYYKKVDKTTLGFDRNKKLIIIVMGSLGSEVVNNRLKDFVTNFKDKDKEILLLRVTLVMKSLVI